MKEPARKASRRTFSKQMLLLNLVMVWVMVMVSMLTKQAEYVIPSAMTTIGALYGLYAGVGHLDYRKALQAQILEFMKGKEP